MQHASNTKLTAAFTSYIAWVIINTVHGKYNPYHEIIREYRLSINTWIYKKNTNKLM